MCRGYSTQELEAIPPQGHDRYSLLCYKLSGSPTDVQDALREPSGIEAWGMEERVNEHKFSTQLCITPQELAATAADVGTLLEGLGGNILIQLGDIELGQSIRIFLRDEDNKVVGGITADLFGGWVYISLLWIAESLRNQGLGTGLLNQLEAEAIRLGCKYAHVDTYSFEARPFYERAGYEVFGKLDDYPQGHCKYFLKKKLNS